MLSWSPTVFTPETHIISYSCQLICGSSEYKTDMIVYEESTTYTLSIAPGSYCTVSVMAVFGTSIISNTVTSSTNTTSAGMYKTYNTWKYLIMHV